MNTSKAMNGIGERSESGRAPNVNTVIVTRGGQLPDSPSEDEVCD